MIVLRQPGIDRRRGDRLVRLDYPALEVPQGGVLLLTGDSGSGKSTLIALIAGLLRPDRGALAVCGTSLGEMTADQRDRWRGKTLGLMPQRLHLSPALSVRENLLLAALAAGQPQAQAQSRAQSLLARLALEALADSPPHALSVGQTQRVALARALMNQPQLLLVDEPTASLDDQAADLAMARLLEARRDSGATLVIATHDARVRAHLRDAEVQPMTLQLGAA